ncbi:uncharacterized protein BBA_01546 [Beauveria bassiana ARSEF 2860]|uniref:Uncharacterized protein n=1 Tax=Beauveria bassiana (strain ARSEF 2860) TaxID=655819 RepID=J5K669_BEAB2|nr:uncharacterized protein BBA_01546 [Beauveria bassiana ARSEF 2860]EJP69581.1 hypothetical protein BBA_01546 [Beauveria bassiana ARSEF 2860]
MPEWNPQVMAKASTNLIFLLKPAVEATLLPKISVLSGKSQTDYSFTELVNELNIGGKSLSIPHAQSVRSNKASMLPEMAVTIMERLFLLNEDLLSIMSRIVQHMRMYQSGKSIAQILAPKSRDESPWHQYGIVAAVEDA